MLGATQNRNESFNGSGALRLSTQLQQNTVNQAVIVFNSGKKSWTSLMDKVRIPVGPLCSSYLASQDAIRIKRSKVKAYVAAKKRRQSKQFLETHAEGECIEEEGISYEAGGF